MKKISIHIILLFSSIQFCLGQSATELLQGADGHYNNGDYIAAEELYRKAREIDSDLAANFNLGNTTFNQERYEEAIEHYLNATKKSDDKIKNSDIFYNLGNAYFKNEKMDEAIDAYKQAIRLNPNNEEAQYNLAYLKEMKKMMQQQPQEQQQESDQQQENQENQEQQEQEQEQQDQQNSDEKSQDEQDQEEQQEAEQDSTQQQDMEGGSFDSTRLEKQTLDSLDAAKLLQIIQAEEQKVQEKLRKFNSNRKKPEKDW